MRSSPWLSIKWYNLPKTSIIDVKTRFPLNKSQKLNKYSEYKFKMYLFTAFTRVQNEKINFFVWNFYDYRIKQMRFRFFSGRYLLTHCDFIVMKKNIIIIICARVFVSLISGLFFPCNWESNGFFVSAFNKIMLRLMASYTTLVCVRGILRGKKRAKQVSTEQLIHFNCSFCLIP